MTIKNETGAETARENFKYTQQLHNQAHKQNHSTNSFNTPEIVTKTPICERFGLPVPMLLEAMQDEPMSEQDDIHSLKDVTMITTSHIPFTISAQSKQNQYLQKRKWRIFNA